MSDVMSRGDWADNAEMIADVARLGYLNGRVLDLTYGHGNFWSVWSPPYLTTNDLHPDKGEHSHNWTDAVPADWWGDFDAVVFDPPYRMSGKKDRDEFDERYGLNYEDKDIPGLIENGTRFAICCANPITGKVLVKVQDTQWRGKLLEQTDLVRQVAKYEGWRVHDRFIFPTNPRPQPPGRTQRTARSNYSTLMVLAR